MCPATGPKRAPATPWASSTGSKRKPMNGRPAVFATYEPYLRSILRLMAAFTFSLHGWQKFLGMFGALNGFKPLLASLMGVAGVLETFGGALILVGLFTRPVAFLLAG